jgi:hypothetical protein
MKSEFIKDRFSSHNRYQAFLFFNADAETVTAIAQLPNHEELEVIFDNKVLKLDVINHQVGTLIVKRLFWFGRYNCTLTEARKF